MRLEETGSLFNNMATIMVAMGILTFILLSFGLTAPYGKYSLTAGSVWGPGMNGILGLLYMYSSQTGYSVAAWLLMGMYTVHYTQRALIYPFFIKQGAQTKASAFVLALVFCLYNGYLQCRFLVLFDPYTAEEHASLRFIAGVLLFCTGMAINLHSDAILRNLRTERNPHFQPGTRYYIPRGGAFEFVSGANFFGEIVEWAGFAIAANSWVAFAFAAFTFANIGPRGAQHHQWLRAKFEDYPAHRRAVIPFLW